MSSSSATTPTMTSSLTTYSTDAPRACQPAIRTGQVGGSAQVGLGQQGGAADRARVAVEGRFDTAPRQRPELARRGECTSRTGGRDDGLRKGVLAVGFSRARQQQQLVL